MSSWVQNISWDSTAIGGMTTAAPATTAAPTTAAPTLPPTVPATAAPSYPYNPNYSGGGGVIFPLPVSASLLMDGDVTALSPLTPSPTTTAPPLPDTLPPLPSTLPAVLPQEEEEKPFWTWQKIALVLCALLVLGGAIWWFFLRKKGGKNNRGNNNTGRRNNTNNTNRVASGYNYNDGLNDFGNYYNNGTNKAR